MHEVRKTVTILFADVVSSTELGERLEAESLRSVVSRYFTEMAQVVASHGGTVEKFIGDEVMAVFGAPVAHEDDALRAVRAAVAMYERLRELNRELEERWGARLEIRIGINTGEVIAGDTSAGHGFVTGDPVNLAKRIEQAAQPGEILIGEDTARIVSHAVLTAPVEPLTAKGKQVEVSAHRVLGIDPSPEAVPRRFDVPLVGRSSELGALRFAYARAVETRRPQLVTVLGAAGIGKSRLTRELLDEVRDDAHVLVGRCLPYGEGITFWPVRDVLPGESLEGTTEEIFARVRTRLQELASERPLVVCFEDVHWGEPTFLDLVQYLAGWIRDAPVVLLCLARPDLLERRPDWATTGADTLSIRLTRLTDEDTAELLEHLDAGADLRSRVAEASEGNPLFVEQMVAMAADGADVTAPPSIRALLTARLDRLEPRETAVIQRAAVIGREFPLRAVVELAPPDLRPHVSAHLLGLVRKEFVRPHAGDDDRFRFRHALIRDAAYEAMSKQLRADLHAEHAAWLEVSQGDDALVGYHLEQAALLLRELGAHETAQELATRAAAMLREYGRRAYGRGDAPAAAALLDRTVHLLDGQDRERASTLVELADACMRLGQFARARDVLDEAVSLARATSDRQTELRAVIGGRILRVFMPAEGPDDDLADDALIAELEALGDDLGLARAWRILSEPHAAACRWAARADALDRALAHAQRLPKPRHEASAIAVLLVQALHFGPAPASETASRCHELLREAGVDLPLQAGIKATFGAVLAAQGHFADAREIYADSTHLHDELGLRLRRAVGTILGAEIEMLADNPVGAERELLLGYQTLEAMGDTGVRAVIAGYLGEALWSQGRYDQAASYVEIAAEIADPEDVAAQTLHRVTQARLVAAGGDQATAERLAREAVQLAETTDFVALQASAALSLADVLAADGQDDDARSLRERAHALYVSKGSVVAAERLSAGLSRLAPKA